MDTYTLRSIWAEFPLPEFPRLAEAQTFDDVIVGGGVTGLSAAYLLSQAGRRVCVLERDRIGRGDSGNTTAHLTCVTDERLSRLVSTFGKERASLAWHAGQTAIETIAQIASDADIDCDFRRVDGYLHAPILEVDVLGAKDIAEEARLARQFGFDVEFVDRAPIVRRPGLRIRRQATINPAKYLAGLAASIVSHGGAIFEKTDVESIESPLAVKANGVRLQCEHVIVATHMPIVGKASLLTATFLQTKLKAYSSYVLSGRLPAGTLLPVALWDTSDPYYYLRVDPEETCDRVTFGGNDHKTGQSESTEDCFERLERTLRMLLPEIAIDYRWSGQVIHTHDGLPYIGEIAPGQFAATGYNGNGYTFATTAALMARDWVLGRGNPWKDLFSIHRTTVRSGVWDYLKENFDYPYYMVADRLHRYPKAAPGDSPARFHGEITIMDGDLVACARSEDGESHCISAICTHLGCIVHWNDSQQTWDCPCHGSRFRPSGEVIAGPAETPLLAHDVHAHAVS